MCLGVNIRGPVLAVSALLLVAASANAQVAAGREAGQSGHRIQGGLGILAGAPVGEFGNNVESAGGVLGHVGLGESVFSIGGEVSYLSYGNESRKVPLSLTLPDVPVTVNTDNAIVLIHARVRVQPRSGRWRPYADGLFGLNYIYTRTSVDVDSSDVSSIGGNNVSEAGFSYGGGGGVMIAFRPSPRTPKLDISARFVAGSEADYLTEGAIRREGGQAILDLSRSRTDLVAIYIGVVWSR